MGRKVNFGGVEEDITTKADDDFPLTKAREVLKDETIAVIGYGVQGPAQSLNMRDNGLNVIVGQSNDPRFKKDWDKAVKDGWKPGETLFPVEESVEKGTIVQYLVSDAAQKILWEEHVEPNLKPGDALYFSHGFSIVFSDQTKVVPPEGVDVIMVAPKGTGGSVRRLFVDKRGINSSYAVERDATGRALERTLAIGIGIGSGYLFPTTFKNEVLSDLTGERAVLLGEIWGLAEACYYSLLAQGSSPGAAFVKSSEQLTQVILPLIGEKGVDAIYEQAQIADELGTVKEYQDAARKAAIPLMNRLYKSVKSGEETAVVLRANSAKDYDKRLKAELAGIDGSDMWKVGAGIRDKTSRDYGDRITNFGLAGAVLGIIEAQYQKFIDEGHSPSEAFNETVEELTQSLNPIYQSRGVAALIGDCSTTAQRGALDWGPIFLRAHLPVFTGSQAHYANKGFDPKHNYTVTEPNMWNVGEKVRELRPERQKSA